MLTHEMITSERKKMGFTSKHLADQLGVTLSTMTRYENGTIQHIPEDRLRKIAEILNCSYDYLTHDDPKYSKLTETKEYIPSFKEDPSFAKLYEWFCKQNRSTQTAVRSLIDSITS